MPGAEHTDSHAMAGVRSVMPGAASIDLASHPSPVPADDARSIRRRAASSAVWIFSTFAAAKVLGIVSSIVLARLLVPADFGLISFSMIVIGIFTLLQDLGVPAALIYTRRDISTVAGTALTINVVAALVLFGATAAISPLLARLGNDTTIAAVATVLAIGMLFSAAGSVQRAMLAKELEFNRKFQSEITALIAEAAVAIGLAVAGFGVWSLVIGFLVKNLMSTAILWRTSAIRPTPQFDRAIARELLSYGKHVSLNSVLSFALNNIDYLLVGYFLGATTLGIYTMAFMIASLPTTAIGQVVTNAMFPAYSRLRHDKRQLIHLFDNTFTVVWSLSIAAGIAIIVCVPPYIEPLLGEKWSGIDEPLAILAIFGTVRAIGSVFPPAYRALGRPDVEWHFTLYRLLALIPLILVGVQYGVNGVAVAEVIVGCVFVPLNALTFVRLIGGSAGRMARLIAPQVAGACLASGVIILAGLLPALDWGIVEPALVAAIALAAYASCLLILNQRLAGLIRNGIRQVRPARV